MEKEYPAARVVTDPHGFSSQEDLDDFLPYLLNRISSRLDQELLTDLRPLRISVPRWRVLAALRTGDGRSMGELSQETVIEQSSLSRVVDQMERDRLVERHLCNEDHRIVEVYLTETGRAMFNTIYPLAYRDHLRVIEGFSEAQINMLTSMLRQVLENVRGRR